MFVIWNARYRLTATNSISCFSIRETNLLYFEVIMPLQNQSTQVPRLTLLPFFLRRVF